MQITARYSDGQFATAQDVICRLEGEGASAALVIRDLYTREDIASWPAAEVHPVPARRKELRMSVTTHPGARLTVTNPAEIARAREMLPSLDEKQRMERSQQFRIGGVATLALGSLILAYLVGVPLLASRIVTIVPPDWEERLGTTVAEQIEDALKGSNGFAVCDPNPNSVPNRAIARFAKAAMEGSGSPFEPTITVIKTDIANAFALPGGQSYYFSALLDQTETMDEFAGVMAHELGHVVHRHGMEQLISTAGTGALAGFVLGDMTGASVAAGLGSALIDSSFSREAERQADAYSVSVAKRLAFHPSAFAELLERVSHDDEFTRAFALLSTHPLTSDRWTELQRFAVDQSALKPPFSVDEWQAIKAMCGKPEPKSKDGSGAATGGKSGWGD